MKQHRPFILAVVQPCSENCEKIVPLNHEPTKTGHKRKAFFTILVAALCLGFITQQVPLSLLQDNHHVEVYLAVNPQQVGHPIIKRSEGSKANHKTNQDLIGTPVLIKLPESKSSLTK